MPTDDPLAWLRKNAFYLDLFECPEDFRDDYNPAPILAALIDVAEAAERVRVRSTAFKNSDLDDPLNALDAAIRKEMQK